MYLLSKLYLLSLIKGRFSRLAIVLLCLAPISAQAQSKSGVDSTNPELPIAVQGVTGIDLLNPGTTPQELPTSTPPNTVITGSVGVGVVTPLARLDVNGGIKVGTDQQPIRDLTTGCDAAHEGTQRYDKSAHTMEVCTTADSGATYAWASINSSGSNLPRTVVMSHHGNKEGNWRVPAGVTTIKATIIGSDLGGNGNFDDRPGGGGGCIITYLTGLTPGTDMPYRFEKASGADSTKTTFNGLLAGEGDPQTRGGTNYAFINSGGGTADPSQTPTYGTLENTLFLPGQGTTGLIGGLSGCGTNNSGGLIIIEY